MASGVEIKPVVWIGSSKDDLIGFPEAVAGAVGYALYEAQKGNKHPNAKPLQGFGGAGVLEVVEDYDGETYGAIYTVRLAGRIYVLHVFQKKSKRGIATPKSEIALVQARLKRAEAEHAAWLQEKRQTP